MIRPAMIILILSACFVFGLRADEVADAAAAAKRQQAIVEYTQKMKDANYPALFDKAADEFKVPADILKAVAFAETRWTQLQWPAGETVSPENGMPRTFGIMSLWDNDYFGHSLREAAKLIGQDPEVLKTDVYQNIRGGAALLRQLYENTPKPSDAPSELQIESWRKAIAKYTGIPQPELSESHALRVYEYLNQGYHQYGIEWDGRKVNLEPMRQDVARIKSAALARQNIPEMSAGTNQPPTPKLSPVAAPKIESSNAPIHAPNGSTDPSGLQDNRDVQRKILIAFMVGLILVAIVYLRTKKKR